LTVSEYISKYLKQIGIEDVFMIDGSACAKLLVDIANEYGPDHCYYPLHEQAGAFAVDGYYKTKRKMAAMVVTSGPAGQNLLNGLAASYYDSIPAIYFTGNVNSRFQCQDLAMRQRGFQECDIVSIVKPVTKYAVMITDPETIKAELDKAIYLATNGRQGPVLLDIPMDIQRAEIDPNTLKGFTPPIKEDKSIDREINRIISLLEESERPAILFGGGIWLSNAYKEARTLIENTGIPYFVTWNAIDFGTHDDIYFGGRVGTFGGDGRNFGIQNCDLLLCIGSRIPGRITGGKTDAFAREATKIVVDIDQALLDNQDIHSDLNIKCDAKRFIKLLLYEINHRQALRSTAFINNIEDWRYRVCNWRINYPVVQNEYYDQKESVNPYVFVKTLSNIVEDATIVVEAGGNCVVSSQAWETKPNQRFFSNNGNSSLGYGLPAAVGAAIADPSKPVICIVGDGGINFNIQELQTIVNYNLPIKIMIFNNGGYGITKLYRDTHLNSNYAGVDANHGVKLPNLISLAFAYGIEGLKINNQDNLERDIKSALNTRGPILCDINMKDFYDYKPRLGWDSPIEDQYPFLPRDEFKANMIIKPLDGWEDPVYPGRIGK